jgi:hypothetical protein
MFHQTNVLAVFKSVVLNMFHQTNVRTVFSVAAFKALAAL